MTEAKIVVVGEGGIGKSACTIRYIQDYFVIEYDPTIEDSYRKQTVINGEPYILDILDTAGEEDPNPMLPGYARMGKGFIIGYSITSRLSFDRVSEFYNLIKNEKTGEFPVIIFGNKCDLDIERQVSTEEGQELAELLNCGFYETSAKEKINIVELFHDIAVKAGKYEGRALEK